MKDLSRRLFMEKIPFGLTAGAAVCSSLHAQLVYKPSNWKLGEFERLLRSGARVKQVYDVTAINGGKFLNNIKNSLNGLHFGFGLPEGSFLVVAGLHGPANMVNYDDYVWNKYSLGAWLNIHDPETGKAATRNIFYPRRTAKNAPADPNSEQSSIQDTSVEILQKRGVRFLSCHTAIEEQVRVLKSRRRLPQGPEEIANDIQSHALPGVLIVASMVAAIAMLQCEGHYSYMTA